MKKKKIVVQIPTSSSGLMWKKSTTYSKSNDRLLTKRDRLRKSKIKINKGSVTLTTEGKKQTSKCPILLFPTHIKHLWGILACWVLHDLVRTWHTTSNSWEQKPNNIYEIERERGATLQQKEKGSSWQLRKGVTNEANSFWPNSNEKEHGRAPQMCEQYPVKQ